MTEAVSGVRPDLDFTVTHEKDRFCFSCERRISGRVTPCRFGLNFHHPLSLDPRRLGFPSQPLFGSSSYVAPERTHSAAMGPGGRVMSGVLRVAELSAQKRFRFHSSPPPTLVGVVEGSETGSVLRIRTHVNRNAFSHGFQAGDVIRLSVLGVDSVVVQKDPAEGTSDSNENQEATEETLPTTSACLPPECSCVVVRSDDPDPCYLYVLSLIHI